jgi:hypothetical protein
MLEGPCAAARDFYECRALDHMIVTLFMQRRMHMLLEAGNDQQQNHSKTQITTMYTNIDVLIRE